MTYRARAALQAKRWILKAGPIGHRILRKKVTTYLISYPKSGRTWLRTLLGSYLTQHFGLGSLSDDRVLELRGLASCDSRIPRIRVTHDDDPHRKPVGDIQADKSKYHSKKVLFLARDPRDIVVSNYFQHTKRGGKNQVVGEAFEGELEDFLSYRCGGLPSILRFFQVWQGQTGVPLSWMLIRYEDLRENPGQELSRCLGFLGIPRSRPSLIEEAVHYGSFERMRARELSAKSSSTRLSPGAADDPESFKTRRGKVGGYRDYLLPRQIATVDRAVAESLEDWWGY